ncbi:MAG: hypothetical protein MZV63_63070 [Marinilabiliales bacterium]|nr:hypothetical protein [Marinilabiliales bacterium]
MSAPERDALCPGGQAGPPDGPARPRGDVRTDRRPGRPRAGRPRGGLDPPLLLRGRRTALAPGHPAAAARSPCPAAGASKNQKRRLLARGRRGRAPGADRPEALPVGSRGAGAAGRSRAAKRFLQRAPSGSDHRNHQINQ